MTLKTSGFLRLRKAGVILEYERGLLYRDGRFVRLLEPGRYVFWRWENVKMQVVSLRSMSEVITGQDILTADRIEVRVSLVGQYAVTDPALAVNTVESYSDRLYQELQLALREAVAVRTIDQLLESRAELGAELLGIVAPAALTYGVTLQRVGLRDVVLPATVRSVFLKEVEADRQGRADLVKARAEVAAARARANTARILAQNPNVARMQEIDALVQLAGRNGNVVLLPNLADLFVPRGVSTNGGPAAADDDATD